MNIEFETHGGIAALPGLSRPKSIATETLPPELQQRIEAAVAGCEFFSLPAEVPPRPTKGADYLSYRVTVKMESRHHTVTFYEIGLEDKYKELLLSIKKAAKIEKLATHAK